MRLIHGECLEEMAKLPDNSVDMVLTDPPYGMGFQSNHRKVKHAEIEGDNSLEWLPAFISEAHRLLRNDSAMVCFCSWHNVATFMAAIKERFKVKNLLVWVKNNTGMGDLKGAFAPKHELAVFAVKGRPLLRSGRHSDILEFKKTRNSLHPTEKPVNMMEHLAESLSGADGVILDPFMGSGTTGVACANLGRAFIGIELDEGYFEIARKRIDDALASDHV